MKLLVSVTLALNTEPQSKIRVYRRVKKCELIIYTYRLSKWGDQVCIYFQLY